MAHDVFISYSSKDKTVADAVVSTLENENMRCWYAPRDIRPGADWGESITEAIHDCKIFLLIFSKNSNQSKRVLDEVYFAISEEKTIIPFRIENLLPTGAMRLHLSSKHWLDAYHPSWNSHLNVLCNSLKMSLGREVAITDEIEETPQLPLAVEAALEKKPPWLWISLVIVLTLILTTVGIIWATKRPNQDAIPPTSSVSDIEPTEAAPTDAEVEQPTEVSTTSEEVDGWRPLDFMIPNPHLWDTTVKNRYIALGPSNWDAFAWSTETFDGDLMVSLDLQRPKSQSDGCVIVYGGGFEFSGGSLIFCVSWDGFALEKNTKYHDGENNLAFSPRDNETDEVYSITIEIIDDEASMYLGSEKVLSTIFDMEEIEGWGRIGLWKNWTNGDVIFSDIKVKTLGEVDQDPTASVVDEFDCELDAGSLANYYPVKSPFISHSVEIDGEISSTEEWSDAPCIDFRLHYGINVTNPNFQRARWWVQNNGQDIFFLVRVSKEIAVWGVFVNYWWPEYTGTWAHSDGVYTEIYDGNFDHGQWDEMQWHEDKDLDPPGTVDIEARFTEDDEFYWFEIRRALNSGDSYDWVFELGKTYGANPYDSVMIGMESETGTFLRYIQLEIGEP